MAIFSMKEDKKNPATSAGLEIAQCRKICWAELKLCDNGGRDMCILSFDDHSCKKWFSARYFQL